MDKIELGSGGGGDTGGGEASVLDSLIDRSITEVSNNATSIGNYAFKECTKLTTADFPLATSIASDAFKGCTKLATVDFPLVKILDGSIFSGCSQLTAVMLRSETMVTLKNANAFTGTPIASGTGYFYVPRALIDSYKSATNWSTYASQFRALEDYTVDGTISGELDPTKI